MNAKHRYIEEALRKDLASRMVFIAGPRQVGKTTLALRFLRPSNEANPAYLNWDVDRHRRLILQSKIPENEPILVFDEIHKYGRWRNFLKGLYDSRHSMQKIIVTGSGRLDFFRRGGDSLLGRYYSFRLHPFSLREMSPRFSHNDLMHLLKFGGFPHPLFKGSETELRRWHDERATKIFYGDLRDLERVREVSLVELLAHRLPECVGSPLSIKSLREDLEVAHETVERWIEMLERIYYCFRILPLGSPKIRAVKKEQKLYLWDWSEIAEPGLRFENLVASQLLKYCDYQHDVEGYKMELRYIRDTDKREVDFVVIRDRKPLFGVECKTREKEISSHVRYFSERTGIPKFYQVHLGSEEFEDRSGRIHVLPFEVFCQNLEMP